MSSDKINGERPSVVEWGGGGAAAGKLGGSLEWLTTDRPVIRGAGIGFAVAGFGLLIAAEVLPWASAPSYSAAQELSASAASGRVETSIAQLPLTTEMFNLGWLVILAAVATALVVRPPVRRVLVAAGLGLVAGQIALLAGITRGIEHMSLSEVFRSGFSQTEVPVQLELGLYCAYAAAALFAVALLLAGGVPRLPRDAEEVPEERNTGPADLTVTPIPAADPSVWSRDSDINVSGRYLDR